MVEDKELVSAYTKCLNKIISGIEADTFKDSVVLDGCTRVLGSIGDQIIKQESLKK